MYGGRSWWSSFSSLSVVLPGTISVTENEHNPPKMNTIHN
uniref:Uncharacterized protein n=1 Tax=Arundo donax TaxID=35708 RepID=A0A0A9HY04_ARUDO